MFYRLDAALLFTDLDTTEDILAEIEKVWRHARVINPGMPNEETSAFTLQKCYHDEDPSIPCEVIKTKTKD